MSGEFCSKCKVEKWKRRMKYPGRKSNCLFSESQRRTGLVGQKNDLKKKQNSLENYNR